jgi:hypothetical protein
LRSLCKRLVTRPALRAGVPFSIADQWSRMICSTADLGHLPQRLADQGATGQVMLRFQPPVEFRPLVLAQLPNLHATLKHSPHRPDHRESSDRRRMSDARGTAS